MEHQFPRHMRGHERGGILMASKIRTIPRLSGMQRLVSQGNAAAPGRTFASLHQLPTGTIAVQFELANMLGDNAVTYNAVYALSAGVNDWFTPLNVIGAPDDTLWVPVTAGGSRNMTVAAAVSANQPARLLTDVMPFVTIPPVRIDGGSGICLFFRICAAAGSVTYHNFSGTVGIWNGYANGQHPGQFGQTLGGGWLSFANNCVEGSYAVPSNPRSLCAQVVPHSVLPITAMPTLTIMSVGDSILSGEASRGRVDSGINGSGLQLAKALDHPKRPALHVNEATAGMTSDDFVANAFSTLDAMVPDIILLQTYSANDPDARTQQGVWNAWQHTMTFAARAAAAGSHVILLTSPPFCGAGSFRSGDDWEAARCYANGLVKGSGLNYIDSDAILGTGRDPVSYRVDCSDDMAHPNELGATLLASAALALLREHGVVANTAPPPLGTAEPEVAPEAPGAHDLWGAGEPPAAGVQRFTIYTYHGTILYADLRSGRLRHGPALTVPHNLFLIPEGGLVKLLRIGDDGGHFNVRVRPEGPFAVSATDKPLTAEDFVAALEMVASDDGRDDVPRGLPHRRFALRGGAFYLCAEGGGDISLNRIDRDLWETFRVESAET